MAQLDIMNLQRIEKQRNCIHGKVYATYTTFVQDGKEYLQIDTYGSSDRELPGKVSQSIQLDKEASEYLISLLNRNFNLPER